MPSVASREEVVELVKTQEENPDLDVSEIFAAAPAHLVDTEPTVAEAQAEVKVALANEAEVREQLARAERATAAARQAVAAAREREDVARAGQADDGDGSGRADDGVLAGAASGTGDPGGAAGADGL